MDLPHDTRILPFGADALNQAAAVIVGGGCVAVPTETVYGLAADAGNAGAVARIYAAKGRPSFNPLIVHVPDLEAAAALAVLDGQARDFAAQFWPGPLTLVLPLRPGAPIASLVTAGLDTVAIRVPAHRAMRALLAATDRPIAAPSANRSNGISPTRAGHVAASLGDKVPLIIDDGACEAGLESTIVQGRAILRPGPIPAQALDASVPAPSGRITAPGQLATHYAPGKPLRLNAIAAEPGEYLIGFGPIAGDATLSPTGDLTQAAARLFDALHLADASGAERIAVAAIPNDGIGEAINDRLARAAHR